MITFDKLKIVTDIEDLTIVDESAFRKVIDKGIVSTLIYHSEKFYLLNVKVDYLNKEAVIEFTGKILGNQNVLTDDQIDRLVAMREKFGVKRGGNPKRSK